MDKQLAKHDFIAGDRYSIADIAIWPWYGNLVLGKLCDAAEFLDVSSYKYLKRWAEKIESRPAVQRGRIVNRTLGESWEQVPGRHSAQDIDKVLNLETIVFVNFSYVMYGRLPVSPKSSFPLINIRIYLPNTSIYFIGFKQRLWTYDPAR